VTPTLKPPSDTDTFPTKKRGVFEYLAKASQFARRKTEKRDGETTFPKKKKTNEMWNHVKKMPQGKGPREHPRPLQRTVQ